MSKYLAHMMALAVAVVFSLSGMAYAGDAGAGEGLFNGKGKCKTCHKLTSKKAVGPGLKGVTTRRTEGWLTKWLLDPQAVWEENDAETQDLKKWKKGKDKKKKTSMKIPKLSDAEVADIIAYLKQNDAS